MMNNFKLWGIVGLVLVVLGAGVWFSRLSAENKYLISQVKELRTVNKMLDKELAANREALGRREKEKAKLADESKKLKQQLEEVYKNDKFAESWSNMPCPPGVLDCLRQ